MFSVCAKGFSFAPFFWSCEIWRRPLLQLAKCCYLSIYPSNACNFHWKCNYFFIKHYRNNTNSRFHSNLSVIKFQLKISTCVHPFYQMHSYINRVPIPMRPSLSPPLSMSCSLSASIIHFISYTILRNIEICKGTLPHPKRIYIFENLKLANNISQKLTSLKRPKLKGF